MHRRLCVCACIYAQWSQFYLLNLYFVLYIYIKIMLYLFSAEKHLSKFFSDTKTLSPEERGKHLESDTVSLFMSSLPWTIGILF